MAATGQVTIIVTGDAQRLRSAFADAEQGVQSFADRMDSIGSRMQSIGAKMTLGITAPLALLGRQAFNAASDLNESLSKVNVVFGENASAIRRWSLDAATSMGMSRQAALEAAGTFGNLFAALGVGVQPAADMSRTLVQLAADLASFNNANPEDVLLALRSGLVGEVEPLRKFGVSLSAARVEAKALEMGLADANGEISESAKVQARYALILEDTKLAQGDFARTADGAANQQRTLRARFEDTAATLGASLLPVFTQVAGALSRLVGWFSRLNPDVQRFAVYAGLAAAALGPLIGTLGTAIRVIGGVSRAFTALSAMLSANPYVALIAATVMLVTLIVLHWDKVKEMLAAAWEWIRATAESIWGAIVEFFRGLPDRIVSALEALPGMLADLALFAMRTYLDVVRLYITFIVDTIRALPGLIVTALEALVGLLWDLGTRVMRALWDGMQSMVGMIIGWWASLPGLLIGMLADLGSGVATAILDGFRAAWNGVANAVNAAIPDRISMPWPIPDIDLPDNPIPRLHSGGVFRAPAGEGLALLRDGETVLTPEQMAALGASSMPVTLNATIHVHGDTSPEGVVRALAAWVANNGAVPPRVKAAFT